MSQTPNAPVDSNDEPTVAQTAKALARALAPIVVSVGVGVGLGLVIEKMKNRGGSDTTES